MGSRGARALMAVAVATGMLALAGCSFSIGGGGGPTTVGSAKVADTVEGILEKQVGTRPDVDCGVEDFALKNGTSRTCVLTDPETGVQYDADVVLNDVDGADFRVDVDVAKQPRAGSAPSDDPSDEPVDEPDPGPPADPSATVTLTGAEIGQTAMSALADQLDQPYEIFCDEGSYDVYVGYELTCTYQDASGDKPAYVTITSVDGQQYALSVRVP